MEIIKKLTIVFLILNFISFCEVTMASDSEKKETSEKKYTSPQELIDDILLNYKNPQKLVDNFINWKTLLERFKKEKLNQDPQMDHATKIKLQNLQNDLEKKFIEGPWCAGKKVLQNIHDEAKEGILVLKLNEIVNLIWYFYALAVEQGKPFVEGTFVIQDKDNLIFTALSQAYERISSHFKKTKQFGIDIPEEQRSHLFFPPYNPQKDLNKSTILFGQIKPELIFIKPESFGISTTKDQIMHLAEFLEPRENEALGMQKERVPKNVINSWKDFLVTISGAKKSLTWKETILKIIFPEAPKKIFMTIQKENLKNTFEIDTSDIADKGIGFIRQALVTSPTFQDDQLTEAQKSAKQKLLKTIDEYGKEIERIGNEVILTEKELNEGFNTCSK